LVSVVDGLASSKNCSLLLPALVISSFSEDR